MVEDGNIVGEIDPLEGSIEGTQVQPSMVADIDDQGGEIRETDIVFDCPHCGHGLVIDYRGAGLVITCVQCGKPVQVPIPEGMHLSDLDQDPENLSKQLANLRTALRAAEDRERDLVEEVTELRQRCEDLDREQLQRLHRLAEIRAACEHAQRVITESGNILSRMFDMIQSEVEPK
jgi:transcription elongation factor Elf1